MLNSKMIRIELTNRCNLKCSFCYAHANSRINKDAEMSTKIINKFLSKFRESGGQSVLFTGGECFLREDLFGILDYSKNLGLQNLVFTNGTLIDDKNINNCVKSIDYVYTSLDGDEIKHEKIRGVSNCFHKTIHTLKLLHENSIPFSIETVIDRTFQDINWIDKYVDKFQPKEVILAPIHNNDISDFNINDIARLKVILAKKNEEYNYRINFTSNIYNYDSILIKHKSFSDFLTPIILCDGNIAPFITTNRNYCLSTVKEYINIKETDNTYDFMAQIATKLEIEAKRKQEFIYPDILGRLLDDLKI